MTKFLIFLLLFVSVHSAWAQTQKQIGLYMFEEAHCTGASPKPDTIWAKNIRTQESILVERDNEYPEHQNIYYVWLDSSETYEIMIQKKEYYDVHFTVNLAKQEYNLLENTEKVYITEGHHPDDIFTLEINMNSDVFEAGMWDVRFSFKENKEKISYINLDAVETLFYNLKKYPKTKIWLQMYTSIKEKKKAKLFEKRKENVEKWFLERGIPSEKIAFSKDQEWVDMQSYMYLMTVRNFPKE